MLRNLEQDRSLNEPRARQQVPGGANEMRSIPRTVTGELHSWQGLTGRDVTDCARLVPKSKLVE